jgi:hypothetical protein
MHVPMQCDTVEASLEHGWKLPIFNAHAARCSKNINHELVRREASGLRMRGLITKASTVV